MDIPHHYDVCPLLARIQPLGWLGAMGMILIGLPIWACQAIALARSALFRCVRCIWLNEWECMHDCMPTYLPHIQLLMHVCGEMHTNPCFSGADDLLAWCLSPCFIHFRCNDNVFETLTFLINMLASSKEGDEDSAARAADRGELSLTHTLGVIEHQMLNLGSGIRWIFVINSFTLAWFYFKRSLTYSYWLKCTGTVHNEDKQQPAGLRTLHPFKIITSAHFSPPHTLSRIHVVSPGRRPGKQLMLLVHGKFSSTSATRWFLQFPSKALTHAFCPCLCLIQSNICVNTFLYKKWDPEALPCITPPMSTQDFPNAGTAGGIRWRLSERIMTLLPWTWGMDIKFYGHEVVKMSLGAFSL